MSDAATLSRSLVEHQLKSLAELVDTSLQVARAVAAEADQPPAERRAAGDLALAQARVARAVRLAIMLQRELIQDLEAAEGAEVKALGERKEARKAGVGRVVERLVAAEHPGDDQALDALMTETYDRLDNEDLYGDLMDRPFDDIVARICGDLGLATSPIAAAMAGGGPLAERSEEPGVEGESPSHNAFLPTLAAVPEPLWMPPAPSTTRSAAGGPPPAAFGGGGRELEEWEPPPPTAAEAPAPWPD